MIVAILLFVLLATGCISSTPRVIADDESAREMLRGRDCSVRMFGIGSTTPNVERAKLDGRPINNPNGASSTIYKSHHVEFTDDSFLLGSKHCVDVVGE